LRDRARWRAWNHRFRLQEPDIYGKEGTLDPLAVKQIFLAEFKENRPDSGKISGRVSYGVVLVVDIPGVFLKSRDKEGIGYGRG